MGSLSRRALQPAMHYMKGLRDAPPLHAMCSMLEHLQDVDKLIEGRCTKLPQCRGQACPALMLWTVRFTILLQARTCPAPYNHVKIYTPRQFCPKFS